MKRFFILIACFSSTLLSADSKSFSRDWLTEFQNEFLCEEKQELSSVGLTSSCVPNFPFGPPPNPFVPPPNPPAPPFQTGQLPIIIVNNSGLPDTQVFITVTGKNIPNTAQVFLSIGTGTGIGTLINAIVGQNPTLYCYSLSQLPSASGGRVFYSPGIRTGLVWFSMINKLQLPVIAGPAIQQPNFLNTSDPNYLTNFDIYEYAYIPGAGNSAIGTDATAVSFFSIPLYGYLKGATSSASTTGLYQPRSFILSHAAKILASATSPEVTQWDNLFLTSGSNILRLLSTGKAISGSLFDANYLDNASAYTYSYIQDIWTGASSFYRTNVMNIEVTVTVPATATYTYTGSVQPDNTFRFTSSNGGPIVTFPAPVTTPTPTGTTTFNIFSAVNFITPLPDAGTAADALSKLVQESMIAGLVPTTNTLSLSYLLANLSNYYTINNNLSAQGRATGPWYDLYSKALHSLGSIYTYGFDEPLWPNVALAGPFTDGETYMSITIGDVKYLRL